jgi:hypothetical protein
MNNLNPYAASSFGGVFRDAPGMLRDWGYTQSIQFFLDGDEGAAFCSGTGSTGTAWSVLPVLTEGQTLNVFGMQGVTSNTGADVTRAMQWALEVTDSDGNNPVNKVVAGATVEGPWFEDYMLPIKIHGPGRVRILPVGAGKGVATIANYITVQYVLVDESEAIV